MEEIWKDVVGYEGLYKVSNLGNVMSYNCNPPRNIYQAITNCGYKQVRLYKNNKAKHIGVHVLVAKAFVDGWFEGAEVNHKDLDKTNNYANNLEWVTHRDNQKHQYRLHHLDYKEPTCKMCGDPVSGTKTTYCRNCIKIVRRKNWPNKEFLEKEIQENSILAISKELGCSDNLVRKMLRAYNLPYKRDDIKKFCEKH